MILGDSSMFNDSVLNFVGNVEKYFLIPSLSEQQFCFFSVEKFYIFLPVLRKVLSSLQDELGETLVHICESVPHGILCFFSSYNMMHKQTERWKCNSIWSRITSTKQVFVEPRYGGDLASIMEEYRELIQDTSAGPRGKVDGALLLAVFRGKVAEGIDFKDNEARCVVTVSYPESWIDLHVNLDVGD